jgi:putative DNA primase/helicase
MAGNPKPALDPWPPLDAPRLEYAEVWSKQGLDPIPLDGKRPVDLDWPNILFAKNLTLHFAIGKRNVGIALGKNGLTDIDLDVTEAIILWREFFGLPTKCVYGRDKKAYSHWLYIISQGIPSIRFQYKVLDPNTGKLKARTIIELRCLNKQGQIGLQSMVPNSINPTTKERVRFESGLDGEPTPVDADTLAQAVAWTAAAVLLYWYWPAPGGGRHDAFLALAGFLLRNSGWPFDDVLQFIKGLYLLLWPNDPDYVAARTEVETTRDSIDQGLPVTGFPELLGLIDTKALRTAAAWLNLKTDPRAQTATQRAPFIISPGGAGASAAGQSAGAGGSTTGGTTSGAGAGSTTGSTYGPSQPPGIAHGYAIQYRGSQPGVYFFPQDPNDPPVFVSSVIEVIGIAADDGDDGCSRIIRFIGPRGKPRIEVIPMSMLDEPAELRKLLHDRGVLLSFGRSAPELLARYLQNSRPPAMTCLTNRVGWFGESFVYPDAVIGPPGPEQILYYQRAMYQQSLEHWYYTGGTFDDWRNTVSLRAAGNSRLVFALCLPFAAPLLPALGLEGGGIHYHDPSSMGKSTTQIVAGSAIGGGRPNRKGFTQTWRTTDNAIEVVAAMHNHNLLLLDEIRQVNPNRVEEIAYMLGNGLGKLRANAQMGVRPSFDWHLLFLSSGEVPLSEHAASAGTKTGRLPGGGAEVRMLNIPADAGAGLGLFEDLHGASSAESFADALVTAATANFGHAQRLFVGELVKDYAAIVQDVCAIRDDFIKNLVPADAGPEVRRSLKRVWAIAAAGTIATQLGVTGWNESEPKAACQRIADDYMRARGHLPLGADMIAAIRQVRRFVASQGSRFVELLSGPNAPPIAEQTPNRAGFYWQDGGYRQYLIESTVFKTEACLGYNHTAVAAELAKRGLLEPGNEKGHPNQMQKWIPGLGRVRGYQISSKILDEDE